MDQNMIKKNKKKLVFIKRKSVRRRFPSLVLDQRHSVAFADFAINDPRSSLKVSCTLLFAMSQLFCGIVIPLSDSFVTISDSRIGHAYYLEAFLIMQYITGIICIFYLQGFIYISERKILKKKKLNIGKVDLDTEEENKEASVTDLQIGDQEFTKVTFNLNSTENDDLENISSQDATRSKSVSDTDERRNSELIPVSYVSSENSSIVSQNTEQVSIVRDNDGINLYLRLGAVGFGFGVMVHDGFKIADKFRLEVNNCHNQLWTPKQCLHLTYIFTQTFFIFKYHRIIFLKQKAVIRFMLYTLVTSNICQWFKTVIYEINHELILHENTKHPNENATVHSKNCSQQLSYLVSPYLFPCAIEYSLISAAVFYKILQKVGRATYRENTYLENKITKNEITNIKYSECHRSHRGLFIGLLFFMVTLVGVAIFFLFKKSTETKYHSVIVYQFSEIILLVSSIITLIWAFIKMRTLKFRHLTEEQALDDNLLLIGLSGVFVFDLFLFISTIDSFLKLKTTKYQLIIILFICKSVVEILQSSIQVLFVLEGSRKIVQTEEHVRLKPGRSLVTFLIIINLALWIVSIFEAKRSDEYLLFTQYYQKTPWSIITHILLPLIIFFRFHSSICLMDIWSKTYRNQPKS